MSTTDSSSGASILRQQASSLGSRRLPLSQATEIPSAQPTAPDRPDLASLRTTFAEELATLEREVRSRALQEAGQAAERELAEAKDKLQKEMSATLEKRVQEQRDVLDEQRQQLSVLIRQLESDRLQLADAMEPVIGRLSIAVVLRLLGRHVADHALVADLARHAVEGYRLSPMRIRVSEADHRRILEKNADSSLALLLHVDHEAEAGSCVIDFGVGQLDAGLETQLNALKAALLGEPREGENRVAAI